MIRTRSLLVAVLAMLVAAPMAHAAGNWSIGIGGGISKLTGDFGKDLKVGPQVGVDVCYHVNDQFAVGAEGSWIQNSHKDVGVVEDLGGGDTYTLNEAKVKNISGGVHGKYMFPVGEGRLAPYALLGLGFYNVKEDYKETLVLGGTTFVNTDESDGVKGETRFGGKGGLGTIYKATEQVGISLQADFNVVTLDTGGVAGAPSTFKFFGVRAGVNFNIMSQ
jgi:hypothetical protein